MKAYGKLGPLSSIFRNAEARVLDQSMLVGNMEQTISMLTESTSLSFKTVQKIVGKFVDKGFMEPTRKIGNAQAYRFDVENDLHDMIEWASKYQFTRSD